MASASEKWPGNKWKIGNLGAAWPRRNTASAFRRLGNANSAVVTVSRDEFFGAITPPVGRITKNTDSHMLGIRIAISRRMVG